MVHFGNILKSLVAEYDGKKWRRKRFGSSVSLHSLVSRPLFTKQGRGPADHRAEGCSTSGILFRVSHVLPRFMGPTEPGAEGWWGADAGVAFLGMAPPGGEVRNGDETGMLVRRWGRALPPHFLPTSLLPIYLSIWILKEIISSKGLVSSHSSQLSLMELEIPPLRKQSVKPSVPPAFN